jgi:uncharacterized repeat protein (TIGR03803 family)
MRSKGLSIGLTPVLAIFAATLVASTLAVAPTEKILYSFNGTNGSQPYAGLIFDTAGNLYGTTYYGGTYNYGTVFELTPSYHGRWTEKVLHSFNYNSTDGYYPVGGLIFDASGNLYGTTSFGGSGACNDGESGGCGTVFELTPGRHGKWTEKVLYSFNNNGDTGGAYPDGDLIFDASGNLYGTTFNGGFGGPAGNGTVFELTPVAGGWTEKTLFDLNADGSNPYAGVIFDAKANLYGTTEATGIVFGLTPEGGGSWTEATLHTFVNNGTDGYDPAGSLIFDSVGNLYGTTLFGGTGGAGTVFELTPAGGGVWTEEILYNFGNGKFGYGPSAAVIFDASGNLYGTTFDGGTYNYGTVFELSPKSGGGWAESVLHNFNNNGKDGYGSGAAVIRDAVGDVYGTTTLGGAYGDGVVFEITP